MLSVDGRHIVQTDYMKR